MMPLLFAITSMIIMTQGDGAAKFTTEYESIEPGQQFTWDNSSMDTNKPKNRSLFIMLGMLGMTQAAL